jgi:hypothetical protein
MWLGYLHNKVPTLLQSTPGAFFIDSRLLIDGVDPCPGIISFGAVQFPRYTSSNISLGNYIYRGNVRQAKVTPKRTVQR